MANEKRLIDANAIGNGLGVYVATNSYLNDTALDALGMIAKWLDEAPTVDAVEVVRCKDCKYQNKDGDCEIHDEWFTRKPDSFCCYGEKKDGG